MIFENNIDIEKDIISKIKIYVADNPNETIVKDIASFIHVYLYELRAIKEIKTYSISNDDDNIYIEINKNNEELSFKICLFDEIRKFKIDKILSRKLYINNNIVIFAR